MFVIIQHGEEDIKVIGVMNERDESKIKEQILKDVMNNWCYPPDKKGAEIVESEDDADLYLVYEHGYLYDEWNTYRVHETSPFSDYETSF